MALPDIYTLKPGSIPAYFDAILQAGAPERFSTKFLEGLDFKSTNDRSIIGILKDLKFLDADAKPTPRYFAFLDRANAKHVLATAIRETYSDLFTLNKDAYKLSADETFNKLRSLYAGAKKDPLIKRIAATFAALCEYADFTIAAKIVEPPGGGTKHPDIPQEKPDGKALKSLMPPKSIEVSALQYHINIVLPDSRDQAVYDAIFKSLREHLG